MNLVEGLSREINRVAEMRNDAKEMLGMQGVNMGPYLAVCEGAIELGHAAIGSNDILKMKAALEGLADIN